MSELRRDPVVGYWTIISTERSRRPIEFHLSQPPAESECPFCEGREAETTPEVFAIRKKNAPDAKGWDVRVILSKMPVLSKSKVPDSYGQGLYDLMEGVGCHEVIIECPEHKHDLDELPSEQIERVVKTYIARINEMEKDPLFNYALLFKNHGLIFGSANDIVRHSRSQLIATPITPKRVKEELIAARNYYERHDRCVFCDMLRQEMKEGARVVAQNEHFYAFCPFAARHPFEVWILPKKHNADFGKTALEDIPDFALILKECLGRIRGLLNDPPFNFVLHTAPFRHKKKPGYWKTIDEDYHWYIQIMPRLTHDAGFEWGTGIYINPTPPEDASVLLREAEWKG